MRKEKITVLFILTLGLLLRLININQSLWLDEAAQAIESSRPFLMQFDIPGDFHPPLFHLILHFWMYVGSSEVWIRIPSLFFSLASIYLIYLLGKKLMGGWVGIWGALFLAVSPFHVWYSQEARPYMLFVFAFLFSTYMLIQKRWFWYALGCIACIYSLYFSSFLFLGHSVYVWIFDRKHIRNFLQSVGVAFLSFLPWIPSFLNQIRIGTNDVIPGWTQVVSVAPIKAIFLTFAKFIFGKGSIENNLLYTLVVLPVFLLFLFSLWNTRRQKSVQTLGILFFVPFAAAVTISFFIPVIAPQRMLFLLPLFSLVLAIGTSNKSNIYRIVAVVVVVTTSVAGLMQYYSDPYVQREKWREAVSFVERNGNNQSAAFFVFPDPFAPFQWYRTGKVQGYGIAPSFVFREEDYGVTARTLQAYQKIFLFQYLTGLTDPPDGGRIRMVLTAEGFQPTEVEDFPGVGFIYTYEKI